MDRARAHLRQHVGVAAKLVVGEDLDVDAALGLLAHAIGRLLGADVERMRQRQVVAVFQLDLGGAGDERRGDRGERGDGERADQRTAGEGHDVSPLRRFDCLTRFSSCSLNNWPRTNVVSDGF